MKKNIIFLLLFLTGSLAHAIDDPTGGKAFFPWLWEDQLKPTIQNSYDTGGLSILLGGAAVTAVSAQYDNRAYQHNRTEQGLLMNHETADFLGWVGNGQFGIGIAVAQLFLDQDNGLKHARAIILTSTSHITLATAIGRERPSGRNNLSFPSGHGSSAFATATSLAYSYGWKAGVPAFMVATAIGASRVNENIHWVSDVVSGAVLGIYWARASAKTDAQVKATNSEWIPAPIDGGLIMNWTYGF